MRCSGLISDLLNRGCVDSDGGISLAVRFEILYLIIQWARHNENDREAKKENQDLLQKLQPKRAYTMSPWNRNFLKVHRPMVFELMKAANSLGIPLLFLITCETTAYIIKETGPKQLRKIFRILELSSKLN